MKSRSFGSGISPACIAAGILRRGTEKRIGDFEGQACNFGIWISLLWMIKKEERY